MLTAALSDLRLAWRTLLRGRGFAIAAVLSLGTGLGLCVAVMTLLNAYLVRLLPYPAADRLFSVQYAAPGQDIPRGLEALDWRSLDDVVQHPIAWDLDVFYLRGAPHPEAAPGAWVTPGFAAGLGIRAGLGRGFEPADFEAGRPNVALISHRLWQQRFGGDPAIVGRRFEAYVSDRPDEAEAFTIVGVLPEHFWHVNPYTQVLAPLRAPTFPYMVRLRDGVRPAVAAERITALVRAGGSTVPAGWQAGLRSMQASYVSQVRPLLLSVAAASGLVLLIACANVSVLLLVRATRQRREVAIRKALGATTGQIARVLVAEAVVLGGLATAVGLTLGHLVVSIAGPLIERQLGRPVPGGISALALDPLIVLGGVACGLLTTGACMLAPLFASRRTPVALALGATSKGATDGPALRRAQFGLVAVEVAACLTLLVGATLMVASGVRMLRVDLGLRTDDVIVGSVGLRQRSYPDAASRADFFERLMARSADAPGLRSLALSQWWPLQPAPPRDLARDEPGAPVTRAGLIAVSASYFETLGIALVDGQAFTSRDRLGTARVAIVSESLAQRLWPGRRAVGERLRLLPEANAGSRAGAEADAIPIACVVAGVARDVRQGHADEDRADVYVPLLQQPGRFTFAYVRTTGADARVERELRAALAAVDADAPLGTLRRLAAIVDEERSRPRFLAALLVGFAGFAALLALLGMSGVIAYGVRQREREIAVRMAIGAGAPAITRLFLRQGAAMLLVGLAAGVGGAVALGRLLRAQLFGVEAADPRVIAAVAVAFGLCGLAAVWWPARRAAATDPASALKQG